MKGEFKVVFISLRIMRNERSNALIYQIKYLAGGRKLTVRLLKEYLFRYCHPYATNVPRSSNHILVGIRRQLIAL